MTIRPRASGLWRDRIALERGTANPPLGEGRLDGEYIVCPWHNWKFHRCAKSPHEPHPLSRKVERAAGPMRVAGVATTAMDAANPRFSGSDHLLDHALKAARELGAETRMIELNNLYFRACEGYYSKAARACTWPRSITQMDAKDEMDQVYEALVHWADAVIVSSPIRWGAASSLYFKMAERLNCVQNAVTIRDQVLIRNSAPQCMLISHNWVACFGKSASVIS